MSKQEATLEVVEAVNTVALDGQKKAEARQAKPAPVEYKTMAVGDVHWQGDVGIQCSEKVDAEGPVVETKPVRQLAPGTSRGSRHCVNEASIPGLKFYALRSPTALDGPRILVPEGQTLVVDHPDHGTCIFPAGAYRIRYQQQYDAMGELRRVRD